MIKIESGTYPSFDETPIYYELRGQGEPIIFIYGIGCVINHWHFQLDYFSKNYQTVAYDLRGHHKSALPKDYANLSLQAIAKDIAPMLRSLGMKKAHFIGHSFGAQVILQAYELFPELFHSITFINGFSVNPIKGMFGLDIVEPLFFQLQSLYQSSPEVFSNIWRLAIDNPLSKFGLGILGGFNLKHSQLKDIEIYTRGVAHLPLDAFLAYFENMMRFNGDHLAEKIKVPTLIIGGDKDLVTPLKFQQSLHELIKGSEFFVVPYGSHCSQLDFPDYVNLRIEKFLKSHPIDKDTQKSLAK